MYRRTTVPCCSPSPRVPREATRTTKPPRRSPPRPPARSTSGTFFTDDREAKAIESVIADFRSKHPKVHVKITAGQDDPKTIPNDYLDSARIDGCGEWQGLLRVVVPMARPGIAATAIFQFFYAWNDYYGPLLYTSESTENWTLSLALSQFKHLHHWSGTW